MVKLQAKTLLSKTLRGLGLARRVVPRPVIGEKAYVQWWQRLLAAVVLTFMVIGIALSLSAAVGLVVVVVVVVLEQAIA